VQHATAETFRNLTGIPERKIARKGPRPGPGYRKQQTYALLVLDEDDAPVDFRVFKTAETLSKILTEAGLLGRKVLVHVNPVRCSASFWRRYRRARTPKARLALAKKYRILSDENVLALRFLILDVDSPFEKAYPVWKRLAEKLGIQGFAAFRTRSGNLRVWIRLARGAFGKYLLPHTVSRNGHTHLENAREILDILCAALRAEGLNADTAFVDRLNHPVWAETMRLPDGSASELVEDRPGAVSLYALYNRVKRLQREKGLWNLSRVWWPEKLGASARDKAEPEPEPAGRQTPRARKPSGDFDRWKAAVLKLAEKHRRRRFIHVMFPAVGWAKYLGLEKEAVRRVLRTALPDKRNFERDFEIAWRRARTLEFGNPRPSVEEVEERILALCREHPEGVERQRLLREAAGGLAWLLQRAEARLLERGAVRREKRKVTPGRGRKAWVYFLTEASGTDAGADTEGQTEERAEKTEKAKTKSLWKIIKELPQIAPGVYGRFVEKPEDATPEYLRKLLETGQSRRKEGTMSNRTEKTKRKSLSELMRELQVAPGLYGGFIEKPDDDFACGTLNREEEENKKRLINNLPPRGGAERRLNEGVVCNEASKIVMSDWRRVDCASNEKHEVLDRSQGNLANTAIPSSGLSSVSSGLSGEKEKQRDTIENTDNAIEAPSSSAGKRDADERTEAVRSDSGSERSVASAGERSSAETAEAAETAEGGFVLVAGFFADGAEVFEFRPEEVEGLNRALRKRMADPEKAFSAMVRSFANTGLIVEGRIPLAAGWIRAGLIVRPKSRLVLRTLAETLKRRGVASGYTWVVPEDKAWHILTEQRI